MIDAKTAAPAAPPSLLPSEVPERPRNSPLGLVLIGVSLALLFAPSFLFPEAQFWLGLFAKFMALAMLAMSVDLVWGYTGLLSLGQGLYFGLGAYMAAYSLTLQKAAEGTSVAPGLAPPQFMAYTGPAPNDPSYVVPPALAWIAPLANIWVALLMAVLLPTLVALLFGLLTFRPRVREPRVVVLSVVLLLAALTPVAILWQEPLTAHPVAGATLLLLLPLLLVAGLVVSGARIGDVYFSLVTQALLLAVFTLIRNQQRFTGGVVGIKDLAEFQLFGQTFDLYKNIRALNLLIAGVLVASFLLCSWLVQTKFGKILTAIRDSENRVVALGYNTAMYKTFLFALAGGLAGLAGVLYVAANELCGPTYLSVAFSIEAVIWVAVGGRGTLLGAIAGALLVGFAQSFVSTAFPEFWPILLGALFVGVVVFLPRGLVPATGRATLLCVVLGVILAIYTNLLLEKDMPKKWRVVLGCAVLVGMVALPKLVMLAGGLFRRSKDTVTPEPKLAV